MQKQEWVKAFEEIHGRLPTAQEFYDAKTNGEFISDSEDSNEHGIACPKCRTINLSGKPFCPQCGAKMDGSGSTVIDATGGFVGDIANKLNSVTGGEGTVELRMRDLFSEAFKPHTRLEAENIFACGSESTTPKPEDISREWPKPWYFTRVFGFLLASTLLLYFMWVTFSSTLLIPGFIFVSSMVGAIPMLFFYFEINSPRNIDIMTVIQIFFWGGLLSLVITLALLNIAPYGERSFISVMIAASIEEVGKVLATAWYIQHLKDKRFLFNGLLIGGAVGAGFDVFENAGYTFSALLENLSAQQLLSYALERGMTGIAAHVVWGAITGAGLMMVIKKQKAFTWSAIWSGESLRFLLLTTILHTLWNASLLQPHINQGILTLIGLIVITIIINRGLKEINDLGKEYEEK